MQWFFILLALVAGMLMPVQAGINLQLRDAALGGDSALAALVSFAVGTLGLAVYCLATRASWPGTWAVSETALWHWSGGLLGAFFVTATILLAPRLGAATMLALLAAGQMLASLWLDQHGLLGYPVHEASPMRMLGAVLIVAGVALVRVF
jgi:transporter family-2 protein